MTRLFIGSPQSSQRPAGWTVVGTDPASHLIVDVAHEPLPLPDNSVDAAMVSHELQRLAPERVGSVLRELRRVVKPGGWRDTADGSAPFEGGLVRMSVPDLAAACRAFVEENAAFFAGTPGAGESEEPLSLRLAAWLRATRSGAGHPFDHDSLLWWLKREGFDGMYRSAYRKSLLPELRVEGLDRDAPDSLFIEAWKTRRAA